MNKLLTLIFVVLLALTIHLSFLTKKDVAAQTQSGIQCTGRALAQYMNAVISGAGDLDKIKLLSPAFNITNSAEVQIFDAMVAANANFNGLDGFAGNTYSAINGDPQQRGAYTWYEQNFKSRFSNFSAGNNVIFTEFGDFRSGLQTQRQFILDQMKAEFTRTTDDGNIKGLNYFNVLGLNPDPAFTYAKIPDADFRYIVGGGRSKRAGANSAQPVDGGGGFPPKVAATGANVGWTLEILMGPDLPGTVNAINSAYQQGMTPVLRLCIGATCAFSDPQSLVSFLNSLNGANLAGPVWVTAGPNEPATETWAAPNCGLEEPGTFTLERVECDETQDPEFHSLRPYPTNPCNTDPVAETLFMCGQDLVAKEVFEVDHGDAVSCDDHPDGSSDCHYTINSTTAIGINLDATELPIVGNTQLVPNAVQRNSTLTFQARMNEYVSWYLNGVIQRAEEKYFNIPQNIFEIINLSGPIRKLLPRDVQTRLRIDEKNEGIAGQIRHDQIVACTAGGDPTPCYASPSNKVRMSNVGNNANSPTFPYIPYSSTEDRVGTVFTDKRTVQPGLEDGIVISNVVYNPSPNSRSDTLYFAHMQENSELGQILQKTYLPQGQTGLGGSTDKLREASLATPFCDILDSRTNPGDDLYGELVLPGVDAQLQVIGGSVNYTMDFDCHFDPPTVDQTCVLNCPIGATCDCSQDPPDCVKQSLIAMSVASDTPKAGELWDRFVDGSASIFKRMFPKVGPNSPVVEIKDIPAEGKAAYSSSNLGGTIPPVLNEPLAGNPSRSRSGANASIFFPHLGSLQEYFLHGIQEALRPFGYSGTPGTAGQPPATGPGAGTCQPGINYCSIENLLPYVNNDLTRATNASQICHRESRSNPFALNDGCLDGSSLDYSVGLFQINLLVPDRCPRYAGVDPQITYTRNPISCSVGDPAALQTCIDYFQDPINNINWMAENSGHGQYWGAWSAARVCNIPIL